MVKSVVDDALTSTSWGSCREQWWWRDGHTQHIHKHEWWVDGWTKRTWEGVVQGIGKGTVATSRNGGRLFREYRIWRGEGDRIWGKGWDRWSHSKVEFEGMEVEKQYNVLIQQHATGQQEELITQTLSQNAPDDVRCQWCYLKKMP